MVPILSIALTLAIAAEPNTNAASDYEFAQRRVAASFVRDAEAAMARQGGESDAALAISKLGSTRSPEGVEFLVKNIMFDPTGRPVDKTWGISSGRNMFEHCHCAYALLKIGAPALPAVMRMVESENDSLKLWYATIVIRGTLGPKFGEAYVKRYLEDVTDPAVKKRVEVILKYLRNY